MRHARTSGRRSAAPLSGRRRSSDGQSLVEFSLVLMPLFFILLGIIQFGFIFNSYVTLTNAVREGARTGTIYIYAASQSKAQNDLARNESIKTAVIASMNLLGKTSPHFTTTGTWLSSGLVYSNHDLVVTYVVPTGVTDTDARVGEQVTVRATYHQDLVIPLIGDLLPHDSGGRLALTSEVTMVVN
ncbi:MAG TPA: TadE/TadG family type IV pilus assembly protein [Candidatus Limnocylindrales bacterium]|jgi:Flp pilus assembly protein TadG|nr:TadE/TadG family type IV pilus assembly protein [Candidatus Limnocylindrales bacterium]